MDQKELSVPPEGDCLIREVVNLYLVNNHSVSLQR